MILVTAINNKEFYLNPDLIYRIEEIPDTLVTLVDGKAIVVREPAEVVVQRIVEYRKQISQPIVNEKEQM
ncbi:flagellar FlbD family protein [Enterococcus saccharolyticus]|uniref:Endoflagellar protein n=1 Tax=Candidatus Enterococcus willemsii TaxID=1857215 RepID=A0ABQ6YWD1_9ENTE|nr:MULTISPECIES: flagellar FlbD family protein [Enterococcus]KAF1302014.1 endoflagellar protein [Enterococcus sp. CU12B]MCD5002878.1 flagellar FlbD family protein [Enterococcus saccharolyticus]